MIDNDTLKSIHQQVTDLLLTFQLNDALEGIGLVTRECADQQLARSLESVSNSYQLMLDFLRDDGQDEKRGEIQRELQHEGFRILNSASRLVRIRLREDTYSKSYNNLFAKYGPEPSVSLREEWEKLQGMTERYDTEDHIFNLLWTMPLWTSRDTAMWFEFISCQDILVQQHFISAIFLSCWEYFDPEKITFLRLMADAEENVIHTLTTTYLAFVILRFEKFLDAYPETPLNLKSKRLGETFYQIQRALILQVESPKVMDKINRLIDNIKQESPGKSETEYALIFAAQLKKYTEEGYDLDLAKMSLIHASQFLRTLSHWFAPFDEGRPIVQEFFTRKDGDLARGLRLVIKNSLDCELNKYALCEAMRGQERLKKLEADLEGMVNLDDNPEGATLKYTLSIRNHIQNLYRFFYHSPFVKDVVNAFEGNLQMPDNHYFRPCFGSRRTLDLCRMLVNHEDFVTPIRLLNAIREREGSSFEMLSLLGVCCLHQKDYKQALDVLTQADFMQPDDPEILEHLYQCYNNLPGRHEEELDVSLRLEKLNNSSPESIRKVAKALYALGRYDEALNYFFKEELKNPDNAEVISNIIMFGVQRGRYDLVEKYIEKRYDCKAPWQDYEHEMVGDYYLLKGMWHEAIEHYNHLDPEARERHLSRLPELGVSDQDCALLADIIKLGTKK